MDTLPDKGAAISAFTGTIWHAEALDLLGRLSDKSIDLVLTDPPYNTTQAHWEASLDLDALGVELFRVIKERGAVISTAAQPFTSDLVTAWKKHFQYEWIWKKTRKTNFLNAKIMPLAAHESILVFGHKKPAYYPQMVQGAVHHTRGFNNQSVLYGAFNSEYSVLSDLYYPNSVIEFQYDKTISSKEPTHPTQKPLALWEYLLKTYSTEGAIILDPFCGSGTSAVAARNLNRQFICGDITQEYVEMARLRLINTDPYQDSILPDGRKQLSLFSGESG